MAHKKGSNTIRKEIWPKASDVKFADKHMTNEGQSVKSLIESIFAVAVQKARKTRKSMPLKD